MVKNMLSQDAIDKLKFVSKRDIQNYVDRENLPSYMGGTVCNLPLNGHNDPHTSKYLLST